MEAVEVVEGEAAAAGAADRFRAVLTGRCVEDAPAVPAASRPAHQEGVAGCHHRRMVTLSRPADAVERLRGPPCVVP